MQAFLSWFFLWGDCVDDLRFYARVLKKTKSVSQ